MFHAMAHNDFLPLAMFHPLGNISWRGAGQELDTSFEGDRGMGLYANCRCSPNRRLATKHAPRLGFRRELAQSAPLFMGKLARGSRLDLTRPSGQKCSSHVNALPLYNGG